MSEATTKFKGTPFRGNAAARAHEKRVLVCNWVNEWGWTTSEVIQRLCLTRTPGQANRLVQAGLLRAQRLDNTKGYLLTERGQQLALAHSSRQLKTLEQINPSTARHDAIAQQIIVEKMLSGEFSRFLSSRTILFLIGESCYSRKIPDAVIRDKENRLYAVEVELSGKWDRRLDEFVSRSIDMLQNGLTLHLNAKFSEIHIYAESDALIERYKKAFEPNAPFFDWSKNGNGEYRRGTINFVPDWVASKIKFFKI